MSRMMSRWVFGLCLVAGGVACDDELPNQGTPRHSVSFNILADGEPIGGVKVMANGVEVGQSGVQGMVHAVLEGREGSHVEISHECPAGFRPTQDAQTLSLVTFRSLDPDAPSGLRLQLECEPTVRHAAFIVDADGQSGVPVLVNDQERGVTNDAGYAHIVLEGMPGASYRVELATADFPRLRPRNPQRNFRMDRASDVFVFDQEFEVEPEPVVRRRRRRRRRRTTMRIIRIN